MYDNVERDVPNFKNQTFQPAVTEATCYRKRQYNCPVQIQSAEAFQTGILVHPIVKIGAWNPYGHIGIEHDSGGGSSLPPFSRRNSLNRNPNSDPAVPPTALLLREQRLKMLKDCLL